MDTSIAEIRSLLDRKAIRAVLADWVRVADPSDVNLEHEAIVGSHIGQPGPSG